jgi:Apea-like HEPN
MAISKDQLIADVAFIFEECARLNTMVNEGRFADLPREDAFCDLPHPTHNWPNGKMMCSRAGFSKLEGITRVALAREKLQRLVSIEPARKVMAEILVRKFIREERPIEIKHIDRAMSETARRVAATTSDLTHYVPCHLMLSQQPSTFQLGPVRFLNRATFRKTLADLIIANRVIDRKLNRRVIFDAVRYFKTFGWVAEITVTGCDKDVSEANATKAVFAALNCLHVLFGARHSKKMTVGGPGIGYDKRGGFNTNEVGELSYRASYGGPGEVGFNDDWLSLFSDEEAQAAINGLGIALEAAANPALQRPISDRFLDAAQWYGEAVRETSQGAKAVKYITALERMVMTDEKDDIAAMVSSRVAALCLEEPTAENRERWRNDTKRAYDIRSKLVHGSLSPTSDLVYEGVGLGADIGRSALLSSLSLIGADGLRAEGVSNKQLSRWYNEMVAHTDRVIENAAMGPQP